MKSPSFFPPAARYRGRFAPTPSGPLHLGSLLTALASWLQARAHGGTWLLRFDDLDGPRCPPGAADTILGQLEAHGLFWDETPIYQHHRIDRYREALQGLAANHQLYACSCTRKAIKHRATPGPDDLVYDGHCREAGLAAARHAHRLRVRPGILTMQDPWQGDQLRNLQTEIGDFIVARSDGVPGYQLASVMDDHDAGITEVVRGSDLMGSSLRQLYLFQELGFPAPNFRHLPVLTDVEGRKLSKQNHATPLNLGSAAINLWHCLTWLGQDPPASPRNASAAELLDWARAHWNEARLPRALTISLETPA